ncbi:MAG: flagellar basal body-associated FliL family protein [Syntrophomonadaceae bacterium]|nr:flagellar basal body-associated FliL family protein [Syntrophomonadaceae bacterium]
MVEENTPEVVEKSSIDFKIILIGLVLFIVAMGFSFFLMRSMMAPFLPEKETEKQVESRGNLVSVGEFTTNINDITGTRFLRVEVFLEVSEENKKATAEIETYMPIIRDTVLTILSSKTAADLDTYNREKMKLEIKNDLNRKIGSEIIQNVYFTSFIMQ